ncbi:MAG: hypothetical protein U0704_15335 [Candidatus Eisenbacteria bacterium]
MAERKPFLLRVDPAVLDALQKWASDDLRSLNGQIEFVLRRALQQEGRGPDAPGAAKRRKPGGGS